MSTMKTAYYAEDELVSISDVAKRGLTPFVNDIAYKKKGKYGVLRNSKIAAVLISPSEYNEFVRLKSLKEDSCSDSELAEYSCNIIREAREKSGALKERIKRYKKNEKLYKRFVNTK